MNVLKKQPPILLLVNPNLVTTIGNNPTWILVKAPSKWQNNSACFWKCWASTTTLLLPLPSPSKSQVRRIWCFLQVCGMLRPHHIEPKGYFTSNTFHCRWADLGACSCAHWAELLRLQAQWWMVWSWSFLSQQRPRTFRFPARVAGRPFDSTYSIIMSMLAFRRFQSLLRFLQGAICRSSENSSTQPYIRYHFPRTVSPHWAEQA